MSKTFTTFGFNGMSNLKMAGAKLFDQERRITPSYIINADIYEGGVLAKRSGFSALYALGGAHSLWGGSVMLCAAGAILYRIDHEGAHSIGSINGPEERLNYEEVDGKVYISSRYWKGIYNIATGILSSWGLPLPSSPSIRATTGNLTAGKYNLCYVQFSGDRISGNGPILSVYLDGDGHGIELLNFDDDYLCWITHPNGGDLFLAQINGATIREPHPFLQPLNTLGVVPPPLMSCLSYGFGRMWGGYGNKVYYSDPFQPEWFRPGNYLPFDEDIVLLAAVHDGLFINSRTSTWFATGGDPGKMIVKRVGDGAVPGTIAWVQIEGGGYEISRKLSQLPSPSWCSRYGIVIGTNNGHLVHLTKARLHMGSATSGASFVIPGSVLQKLGVTITGVSGSDPMVVKLMRDGRLV